MSMPKLIARMVMSDAAGAVDEVVDGDGGGDCVGAGSDHDDDDADDCGGR